MDRATLLRTTYRINAVATFVCGAALLAAGHWLASPFAVPALALRGTGTAFILLAAWIRTISRRPQLLRSEAAILGVLDAGYALASVAAVVAFWQQMTPELRAAVGLIAAPVALFALIELSCAARAGASPADVRTAS